MTLVTFLTAFDRLARRPLYALLILGYAFCVARLRLPFWQGLLLTEIFGGSLLLLYAAVRLHRMRFMARRA